MKDIDNRCRCSSGGRSGAFFFFTIDRQFIIKTITLEELHVFKSIIAQYTERITSSSGSYIAKIFGIFKIKKDKNNHAYIIIMENIGSITENPLIFDMKGSTLDRKVLKNLDVKDIEGLDKDRVYKDVDFFDLIGSFHLSKIEINSILSIIESDTLFLETFNIMDYSLLLILGNKKFVRGSIIANENHFFTRDLTVLMGIIDFLQTYNMKKKIEGRYKKLRKSNIDMSSIPPKPYRKRFLGMIKKILGGNLTIQ